MSRYRFQLYLIGLFPLSLGFILLSRLFPSTLEWIYSTTTNKCFISILSHLTGWFPFSLFEYLIIVSIISFIVYFIYTLYQLIYTPTKRSSTLLTFILNFLAICSSTYFIFILFWGLNYYRLPIEDSFQLSIYPRSVEELEALYEELILSTNEARDHVLETSNGIFSISESPTQMFNRAPLGYLATSIDYPILAGDYGLPKAINLSNMMNYTQITGIYSPFTAEANVNIAIPESTLLFTTMHEMAHQRGFASENEANFIAFLTCIYHPDADFQYSGYLSALNYTSNALAKINRERVIELNQSLSDGVKRDLIYQREFWSKYEGKVEQTFTNMNQTYLKLNGVSDGVQSYGRVVDLLLAYYDSIRN